LPLRLPLAFIWMGCPAGCAGACCCACCCTCCCAYCCTCCPPTWAIAGCISMGGGGTGFWMITAYVEVIGSMSTGISSP
jgi:hypothetical protein